MKCIALYRLIAALLFVFLHACQPSNKLPEQANSHFETKIIYFDSTTVGQADSIYATIDTTEVPGEFIIKYHNVPEVHDFDISRLTPDSCAAKQNKPCGFILDTARSNEHKLVTHSTCSQCGTLTITNDSSPVLGIVDQDSYKDVGAYQHWFILFDTIAQKYPEQAYLVTEVRTVRVNKDITHTYYYLINEHISDSLTLKLQ